METVPKNWVEKIEHRSRYLQQLQDVRKRLFCRCPAME